MKEATNFIEIKYYEEYFEAENIEILKDELSKIGNLRTRGFFKELGGESPDLVIAIQWFGLAVLSGIIQHLTTKNYERILSAIRSYREKSKIKNSDFQPYAMIIFSYDDLDIEITMPNATNIDFFVRIMKKISERISSEPLKARKIIKISIPYYFDESEEAWMQTFDWKQVNFESRYWAIATKEFFPSNTVFEDIYDSEENRFLKAPAPNIISSI